MGGAVAQMQASRQPVLAILKHQHGQKKAYAALQRAAEEVNAQVARLEQSQQKVLQTAETRIKEHYNAATALIGTQLEEKKQSSAVHAQAVADVDAATDQARKQMDAGVSGVSEEVTQFCLAAAVPPTFPADSSDEEEGAETRSGSTVGPANDPDAIVNTSKLPVNAKPKTLNVDLPAA